MSERMSHDRECADWAWDPDPGSIMHAVRAHAICVASTLGSMYVKIYNSTSVVV